MTPEIRIKILEDGRVVAEVHGVDGPACVDLAKFLDGLGQVEEEGRTADYYKDDNQGVILRR